MFKHGQAVTFPVTSVTKHLTEFSDIAKPLQDGEYRFIGFYLGPIVKRNTDQSYGLGGIALTGWYFNEELYPPTHDLDGVVRDVQFRLFDIFFSGDIAMVPIDDLVDATTDAHKNVFVL